MSAMVGRKARIVRQPVALEDDIVDIVDEDILEQAQDEVDVEDDKIAALKTVIRKLQSDSPDEQLSISIRTRISEWKPWSVLPEMSRKVTVADFDLENIISDVQSTCGDGNYKLVIYFRGHAFKHYEFFVGDPRNPRKRVEDIVDNKADIMALLPTILQANQTSSNQMMQMLMLMMQQSRESSDRNMQAQMQMIGLIIPAISGGRTDPTELMSRFAVMFKELQPPPQAGGMDQLLDNAVKIKALIGGDNSGGKETNAWDILKEAAPAIGAAISPLLSQVQPASTGANGAPVLQQRLSQNALSSTPQPAPLPAPAYSPQTFDDPILALIGEDILFFAKREYDTEIAADTLTDRLDNAGVTLAQLQAHFGEWIAANPTGDWLEALAQRGLDLRQYREWTSKVIAGVIDRLNAIDVENPSANIDGQGRSKGNVEVDGAIGTRGIA
jgi:hypothetical protein